MNETKKQILQTTCALLERQGYHGSGLNEIIRKSGAPRGSLYYYFPGGKEELAVEAIETSTQVIVDRIRDHLQSMDEPADAIRQFIYLIAENVEASQFSAGGPLATIAMETATTNERLNLACREGYAAIRDAFSGKLINCGCPEAESNRLAVFITAAIEGGVLLARTDHSGEALRQVADYVADVIRAASC